MKLPTRIRATRRNGRTVVAVLIKNSDIRARTIAGPGYLSRLKINSGESCVVEAFTGSRAATNPLLKFEIEGMEPGAALTVSWKDNRGYSGSAHTSVV